MVGRELGQWGSALGARSLGFVACALLMLWSAAVAWAESPIVVTEEAAQVMFPRYMQFTIQARSTTPIRILRLTVWPHGVALGMRHTPTFTPGTDVRATFTWDFQFGRQGGYLPPGASGEYSWHIEDEAGNVLDTPRHSFRVLDRTQAWQTRSDDRLSVSWYIGDASFGAAVFERAREARAFLTRQLAIQEVKPLQIFIYGDRADFFRALPVTAAEWTGGRIFPEYGVILINFGPDDLEWGLRATSHELSHAILDARISSPLGRLSLPRWLNEGLAVYNETTDHTPDPQFEKTLQHARRRNALLPLSQLAEDFPRDSDLANLAYGQSYSVVKFMIEELGADKFAQLLDVFRRGAAPDDALWQIYDMRQDELENAWRHHIGVPPREISPRPTLEVVARPTYELSSPLATATPAPPTATDLTPSLQHTPTVEPTRAAVARTTQPAPVAPEKIIAVPPAGRCGGVMAMVLFGIFGMGLVWQRRRRFRV